MVWKTSIGSHALAARGINTVIEYSEWKGPTANVWYCPNCHNTNEYIWDACNSCGFIATEKKLIKDFKYYYKEDIPEEKISKARKPRSQEEILRMENPPPNYETIIELIRD